MTLLHWSCLNLIGVKNNQARLGSLVLNNLYPLFCLQNVLYLRGLLTNYQKFLIKQFVGSAWLGHCLCPVLLILPTKCAVFERFINKLP